MNNAPELRSWMKGALACWLALWTASVPIGALAGQTAAGPGVSASDAAVRADTCARLNRRFDAAFGRSADKPPLARLRALHRAGARVGEDPAGCVRDRIIDIERRARGELVRLLADGTSIAASRIVPCARLDADLRCTGWAADDAGSISDLSVPAPLAGNARLRLAFWPGYHPRRVRAYARDDGARGAQPLGVLRDGRLDPGDRRDGELIVVIEEGTARPVIQYVWALTYSQPK